MPTLIKNVRDLHRVEFDMGRFDEWCVYLKRNGMTRYAPVDTEYFGIFRNMAIAHGAQRIYNDFVSIYTLTRQHIDPSVLNLITTIADSYKDDAVEMDIWLSVIYGGMIAEENKVNMVLKRRIKRLGMYQVLIENLDPAKAAVFSFGKKWRDLDKIMTAGGF